MLHSAQESSLRLSDVLVDAHLKQQDWQYIKPFEPARSNIHLQSQKHLSLTIFHEAQCRGSLCNFRLLQCSF